MTPNPDPARAASSDSMTPSDWLRAIAAWCPDYADHLDDAADHIDELERRLSATPAPAETGAVARRVRHKKRGTTYEVIATGKVQTEDWKTQVLGEDDDGRNKWSFASVDMAEVIVYRSEQDGSVWVRPKGEFEDGRFEDILAALDTEGRADG